MGRKTVVIAIMAILMHTFFVLLSFDAGLLSSLGAFANPITVERTVMFLQFVPLLIVIINSKLSKSRILLFVTFAISISTLFIVDDFNTGFYGAAIDNNSSTMPRMRASAHLMAYNDTGRLAVLDYHGEYFLEFILVHFLSRVSGLNCVFTYFFIVRILVIVLWSALFVWGSNAITGSRRALWLFLFASSIMLANQSYNHEISFGPILLVVFYLIVQKKQSRRSTLVAFLIVVTIMSASFRETLLIGVLSLIALLMTLWTKTGVKMRPKLSWPQTSFTFLVVTLSITRIFLLTSAIYSETYTNYLSGLVESISGVFRGGISLHEPILTTLESVQNPLDKATSQISVFFAVSFLAIIAILLARLAAKRDIDTFSLAISLAFILMLSVPLAAYGVEKIMGAGPLHDFGSATTLARSLTPLAIIMIVPHYLNIGKGHFPYRKFFSMLVVVCLSLNLVFSPFIFLRKEAKSAYDVSHFSGDMSEYTILGNHMYEFVTSRISNESEIRILSPAIGFLQHYDLLPLEYRMGRQIETGPVDLILESKIYDNAIFTISTGGNDASTIFLNELKLLGNW